MSSSGSTSAKKRKNVASARLDPVWEHGTEIDNEAKKNRFRNEPNSILSWAIRKFEARQKLVAGPAIDEKLSLPFNMNCKGCTSVIAAGVKLNDEREKVNTLSGKVWEFHVKCPCCGFDIVIQTCRVRPGYIIIDGAEEHPERARSQAHEEMLKLTSVKASPGRIMTRPRGQKEIRLL